MSIFPDDAEIAGHDSLGNDKLVLTGSAQRLSEVPKGIPTGASRAILRADVAFQLTDQGADATTDDWPIDADVEWTYDGDSLKDVSVLPAGAGNLYVWFYT